MSDCHNECTVTPLADCPCCDYGPVSIEITTSPSCGGTHCPPESFIVSYGDGTSRVMTEEEREAFLASMAAPWN